MRVNGVPNKFEIFQDFYYRQNGEVITYGEALKLFSQMEADEKAAFEQYYKDETGYEIISLTGYNLVPDLGELVDTGKTKIKKIKKTRPDGSVYYEDKIVKIYTTEKGHNSKSSNIATQYTLEAYAKKNGMTIDPQWAGYSAEEIIQMADNGVNIPQDVVDAAHSILASTASNMSETDAEDGDAEATTEKEPFLNLIPKAQKKIEKCNENNEKIDDKIEELLPEKNKKQKKLTKKMEDQRNSLREYEAFMREWRTIQNKINNGEELTESEAKRYAQLTGMLNEDKSKDGGFEIDKREIAKSLNDLNILAALGEKLADETIEIGDTLADYTSKANYKTTCHQASGQIGFLAAIIAMARGENLASEATVIGNDTKEYTDETHQSVMEIAKIVGIEGSIADTKGNSAEDETQISHETAETVDAKQAEETSPENNEEKVENEAAQETNDSKEEDFILNDESVLKLIDEAGVTNDELKEQIIFALQSIKNAKSDKAFAKFAGKKIEKLINEFNKQEEARQQKIQKLEEENKNINEEKERAERIPGSVTIDVTEDQTNEKTVDENNKEIENIKAESAKAKEDLKAKTATEKSILNEAIPVEDEAFNINKEFKNTLLPTITEQLDFTNASGISLAKIGLYMFEMGLMQMMGFMFSRRAIWLMHSGIKSMVIGAQAHKEATKPYLEVATKATDTAEAATGEALTELTSLDTKIISATGDEAAETPASDEQAAQEENTENGIVEANTEASVNDIENTENEAQQTEVEASQTPAGTQAEDKPSTVKMVEENQSYKDKIRAMMESGEKSEKTSSNTQKSEKNENKEISKEEAQKNVDDTKATAKDDNKDSVQTLQDTQKDEKQLEKEAKQIQKTMQKDQKEIIKMTKESEKAAKKQEEMFAEYEGLVSESEQLIAEDEQKKQTNAATQPADNNAQAQQAGALSSFSMNVGGGQDNTQQLQENELRINTLGTEFKLQGKVITRNSVKIKKLQKTTKTNQKKFDKKVKVRETKIKEAEKKEQDKQKRLAKQLGVVGIAENVFSITVAIGTIMSAIPWTAAAGAILIKVGTYGIVCCGLTKAMINLANGNLTAALIGLGQTAVTAVMSLTGTGAAANSIMQCVSAGLQVVSSSAELVNNVRTVQGKEASGVFSKISTIAGVASAVTSAASSFTNATTITKEGTKKVTNAFKQAGTFGKALQITSAVGTVMSSASQLMSEFGADGKAAELLGMIGGGLQTAASVVQLAQKFAGAEAKNEDNKNKTDETSSDNTDKNNNAIDNNNSGNNNPKEMTDAEIIALGNKPQSQMTPEEIEIYNKYMGRSGVVSSYSGEGPREYTLPDNSGGSQVAASYSGEGPRGEMIVADNTSGSEVVSSYTSTDANGNEKAVLPENSPRRDAVTDGVGKPDLNIGVQTPTREELMNAVKLNPAPQQQKNPSFLEKAKPWMELGMNAMSTVQQIFASSDSNDQQQQNNKKSYVPSDILKNKKVKKIQKIRKMQQQHARNYTYKRA